ncbi:MAG: hypothetical protein LBL08_03115 [Candidatus Nomurabacteria bacterium]|jgi:hypothetical protein|nr:hypothetical protein [Candidatus Nomurabacteria bacterium]
MIPIYWSGNPNGDTAGVWKTTTPSSSNWYDYTKKQWANAVTVAPASLSTYHNTTNVTVQESDVLGYWVYIPRYRYQIQRYSALGDPPIEKPLAFNIQFENKDTPNYEKAIPEQNHDWATHPAFSFGDEDNPNPTELNGIWIAKFEATGTAAAPTVKPNLSSLMGGIVGDLFSTSINMSLNPDGAAGGNTIIAQNAGQNTHKLSDQTQSRMARNTDWGAVVYLTTSSYGRNATEVWNNNCYGSAWATRYITGISGNSVSDSYGTLGEPCQGKSTISEIPDINKYNGRTGVHASTTDNIYGIYDMSGGSEELVMSNRGAISDTSVMATMPQTRYIDIYYVGPFGIKPTGSASSNENFYNFDVCTFQTCGGQALSETTTMQSDFGFGRSSWFSEGSIFVDSSYPWATRGGPYYGFYSGIFSVGSSGGDSFRPILSGF